MKRFFALSRTSHGVLDLATPAFCALLWGGRFPAWNVILLSIFTAFAAYTAIYALNDLIGMAVDKEKFSKHQLNTGYSVEASELRYPLARGILSFKSGLLWMGFWLILALVGSYLLNPTIVFILIGATILEIVYCLLLKITYLRTFISGFVKASGPIAAVFVVDPKPALLPLLILLVWVYFWEIGGQNVPADWNDTAEDTAIHAKTIPIHFGPQKAALIVLAALTITVITSAFLPLVSPARLELPYILASLTFGFVLLLQPSFQLNKERDGRYAAKLFDRASYYPVAQFALLSVILVVTALIS